MIFHYQYILFILINSPPKWYNNLLAKKFNSDVPISRIESATAMYMFFLVLQDKVFWEGRILRAILFQFGIANQYGVVSQFI